jgi:hypothetical protein
MGKVLMEITMSLDDYITGPEVSAEEQIVANVLSEILGL